MQVTKNRGQSKFFHRISGTSAVFFAKVSASLLSRGQSYEDLAESWGSSASKGAELRRFGVKLGQLCVKRGRDTKILRRWCRGARSFASRFSRASARRPKWRLRPRGIERPGLRGPRPGYGGGLNHKVPCERPSPKSQSRKLSRPDELGAARSGDVDRRQQVPEVLPSLLRD